MLSKMTDNLFAEFNDEFEKLRKELGFKASLSELDEIFSLTDFILKFRFVPTNLSYQIRYRIVEYYNSSAGYLHSLLMPNPQNLVNLNESKLFNSDEKKLIGDLFAECMHLNSRNTLINLNPNKKEEGKLIDDAVKFWKGKFKPESEKIFRKVNKYWSGEK